MKELLILRHAHTGWTEAGTPDHQRPLSPRGRSDAPRVGRMLRDRELLPDLILTSTAERARATGLLVGESSGFAGPLRHRGELYLADPFVHLEVLAQLARAHPRVLIVGHNPGLEALVLVLTGEQVELSAGALARLRLPIDRWSDLGSMSRGALVHVWRPEEIEP